MLMGVSYVCDYFVQHICVTQSIYELQKYVYVYHPISPVWRQYDILHMCNVWCAIWCAQHTLFIIRHESPFQQMRALIPYRTSHITHHTPHTTHHTPHTTHHTSHITHHTSHIAYDVAQHFSVLGFLSHIAHHTSHIAHHTSHITHHTIYIAYRTSKSKAIQHIETICNICNNMQYM